MAVKTFAVGELVTASDANTYLANAGLDYIGVSTASAATTLTISGFSSTWENYRIVASNVTATSGALVAYVALNGTASGTTYYSAVTGTTYAGAASSLVINNGVWWSLGAPSATIAGTFTMDVSRLNIAAATSMTVVGAYGTYANSGGGLHNTATAYNQIQLGLYLGGTFSGTFRLYGYRQA